MTRAAGGEALGELVDIDLLERPRRQCYRAAASAADRSSGVLTLRSVGRVDGDRRRDRSAADELDAAAATPPSQCRSSSRPAPPAPQRQRRLRGGRSSPRRRRRPAPSAAAASEPRRPIGASSSGQVAGAPRRRRRRAASSAVRTPPAGPRPASDRRTTGRPSRASSTRVAADEHDRRAAGRRRAPRATRSAIATPPTSTNALSVPIRRLRAAAEHGAGRSRAGASPGRARRGRAGARNVAMRSASSVSPIAAAIAPSPASDRRKPRLVGADQRTYPEPRQPLARRASRPRW